MRVMNGRLHNFIRSPLIRSKYLRGSQSRPPHQPDSASLSGGSSDGEGTAPPPAGEGEDDEQQPRRPSHHHHHRSGHRNHRSSGHHRSHHHHNGTTAVKLKKTGKKSKGGQAAGRRRSSADGPSLPKSIQFDESSDAYRCLCGCFHVKTGAMCIAGIELFLIFCYFVNALVVLLQQRQAYGSYDSQRNGGGATAPATSADYVPVAFAVASAALALALLAVLLMLAGVTRNIASLLIPHLIAQALAIVFLAGLLLGGGVALVTDHANFYRLLHAAPFNDYPGQATVALDAETAVRVHAVLGAYALTLALELWFIVIVYNCYGYFTERRKYMNYCLAYSTPMKTLNSARYS